MSFEKVKISPIIQIAINSFLERIQSLYIAVLIRAESSTHLLLYWRNENLLNAEVSYRFVSLCG